MKRSYKFIIILVVFSIVLLGFLNYKHSPSKLPDTDYGRGTTEQKQDSEDKKISNAPERSGSKAGTGSTNGSKKKVQPVIASADQNQIKGFVPDIYENGGVCTAALTQGDYSFQKTSSGFENVNYVQCNPIIFIRSDFPNSGIWTYTVAYSSPLAEGTSKTQTIEVH